MTDEKAKRKPGDYEAFPAHVNRRMADTFVSLMILCMAGFIVALITPIFRAQTMPVSGAALLGLCVMGILALPVLLMLWAVVSGLLIWRKRLFIDENGVEYQTGLQSVTAAWDEIQKIGGINGQICLVLAAPNRSLWFHLPQVNGHIPLGLFVLFDYTTSPHLALLQTPVGKAIYHHAPHLFEGIQPEDEKLKRESDDE